MDVEAIYAGIVDGTRDPGDLSWTRRKLQLLALERAKAGPADARLGALRVAAVLGPKDGLPIAQQLVRDADPRVRTWAFNQAVAARELGLPAIRDAAEGADADLAVAALDLLNRWVDQAGVPVARRCLAARDPRVRAGAARLLGNIGGTAVRLDLSRLLEGDADPTVRDAAAEALQRLLGTLPKMVRTPWWDDATPALPTPPPVAGAAEGGAPSASASPPPDTTALVPATPREPPPGPTALPSPLPTEPRALVKLLALVAPSDRAPVVDALRAADGKELSDLLLAHTPGGEPALGRGVCLAIAHLPKRSGLSKARQLQGDPDPGVRAAAAEAIGAIGHASAIPALVGQLDDRAPEARAAAIGALAALALRIGRPELAREPLGRLRGALPDEVAGALGDALRRLGG